MLKFKSTKKALLLSALAILTCASMLIGTTFAWFTDSVSSGSNIIKSGNLEVSLIDANGNSLEGEMIEWVVSGSNAVAQEDILWEPGCTYDTEEFYIKNTGDLNLKFKMIVNGIDGDNELLEAIEFKAIVENYSMKVAFPNYSMNTTVDVDLLNGTTVTEFLPPYASVTFNEYVLEPGEAMGPIVLTGHMKEEAGNEYQGLIIEGVSVSVIATQAVGENDSHVGNYDYAATFPEVSVPVEIGGTAEDLVVSTDDASVNVPAEVVATLPASVKSVSLAHSTPEHDTTSNTITFDSVELVDQSGNVIDLSGNAMGDLEIVLPAAGFADGTIVSIYHDGEFVTNATVANGEVAYSAAHLCKVEITIPNVITTAEEFKEALTNGGNYVLANDITTTESVSIPKGVSVVLDMNGNTISGDFQGYIIRVSNGGSLIIGGDGTISGSFGALNCHGKVVVEDGTYISTGYAGNTHHCVYVASKADVTILGGTFMHNGAGTSDSGATVTVYDYDGDASTSAKLTIKGGTFTGSGTYIDCFSNYGGVTDITVCGGTFTKDMSKYTKNGFVCNKNGDIGTYTVIEVYDVAADSAELQALITAGKNNIHLLEGSYLVDLYNITGGRKLTITGCGAATKLAFSNLQVRASQFTELTINNCTIERMPDKSWGHLVFGSSEVAGGVYTINNCVFNGVGSQGIYINQYVPATFNINNCVFNGDFSGEGAITIQNNKDIKVTVNVNDCRFAGIPETSHEIFVKYAYDGLTLNAPGVEAYWKNDLA